MGIAEIRALKEKKGGTVLSATEARELFSGKKFSNNGSYHKVQRDYYECSKGSIFFRSKWEANYALYLDYLVKQKRILEWEYEAQTFLFDKIKLGTKTYTPDFKIKNLDGSIEYHEVKGFFDSRSKTKLKRMRIYFPAVKIILVEKKTYEDILKKMKGIIKFY